ncbi:GyrI-like domain-containing protein [Fulvivirga sp. 29W222]|uniref:GyrI-like domain-containing protein n=1 Tax=Fulvivirga marina TaxID=2494733 RepID=A0A937KD32_9BACT|nr:GyrI-like domain-containing protein [Fulvivirga marina]MBL6448741.1 GyrI-like domain-containing protein [Fulvivirga marina]
MSNWHKFWISLLAILFILFLLAVRYKSTHMMKNVEPFEINTSTASQRIVIATQGSEFKDSVVNIVIDALKAKPVYIKVIDVNKLTEINEDDWGAIAILHTWEYTQPQEDAKAFVENVKNKNKLIVMTTSGEGSYVLDSVDGISSASNLANVTQKAKILLTRINKLLNKGETYTDTVKYDIVEVNWPQKTFITKREKLRFDQLSDFFSKNYKAIYSWIEKNGIETNGVPSAVYFSIDETKQETDLAAAVPVKGELPQSINFEILKTPPAKVITTTHYGSYESIHPAYSALDGYLKNNGLKKELIIEEYYSDPVEEKDTSKWMTKIYFVIK